MIGEIEKWEDTKCVENMHVVTVRKTKKWEWKSNQQECVQCSYMSILVSFCYFNVLLHTCIKQCKFISLQFWILRAKINLQDYICSGNCQGESFSFALPTSRGCLCSLASSIFRSATIASSPHWHLLPSLDFLSLTLILLPPSYKDLCDYIGPMEIDNPGKDPYFNNTLQSPFSL